MTHFNASKNESQAPWRAGDLLAFSGGTFLSDLINLATFGIPRFSISHVGIIGEHHGELLLFESTTLNSTPCAITGLKVRGSQAQRVGGRLESYRGKVWHYPLYRRLYAHESQRLSEFLVAGLGRPYDDVGAVRAGGAAFSWFESKLRPPNLASLFCSEWVAAALAEIGILPTNHASRWNPNRLIRKARKLEILQTPRRVK